jgi:hypothetical protein
MADYTQSPSPAWPGQPPAKATATAGRRLLADAAAIVAAVAASAVLGLLAGLLWKSVAPRAVIVVVAPGSYGLLNPESTAFIVADAWFSVLCLAGGALCGLAGWLAVVRRTGPVGLTALLGGGVLAAFAARWAGQRPGSGAFSHQVLTAKAGTLLHAPLTLGAQGALAFWPLAAAAVAGGIELSAALRDRRARWAGPRARADGEDA